jgi:tetratricopeptide (TPR) repeat protein
MQKNESADTAEKFVEQGNAFYEKSDYNAAIETYTKAISLDPVNVIAYGNRGSAHSCLHDYDKAIADFTEAIKRDPKNADAKAALTKAQNAKLKKYGHSPYSTTFGIGYTLHL